jgi:hypothetical protein
MSVTKLQVGVLSRSSGCGVAGLHSQNLAHTGLHRDGFHPHYQLKYSG